MTLILDRVHYIFIVIFLYLDQWVFFFIVINLSLVNQGLFKLNKAAAAGWPGARNFSRLALEKRSQALKPGIIFYSPVFSKNKTVFLMAGCPS